MSYLNNIYVKPPINLVDGVVKDETIINLGYQIETAFENIGDIFGNLYGDGLETAKYARYFNSLSSALGNMGILSPEEPFTTIFDSYSQGFINNNLRKDFVLDLKPIEGEEPTTITIVTGDGISYSWVATEEELSNVGDFTTNGRVLTFYTVPVGNFSAIYKGAYPEFGSQDGYLPNIYPSPNLVESGVVTRPVIEVMPSGRYRVTIAKTNQNQDTIIFGAELDLKFNELINQYVSAVGNLEVPKEYVNAWMKFPHSYERLPTRAIYILNDYQFEIDTDEDIDINSDIIVFSISNVSLANMVKDLYTLVKNHNHDNSSMIATIDHDSLTKLTPVSDNPDIIYSKSKITNNDHPEYLHREGYRLGDPGTYNNSLLGSLLISSIDSDSGYGNILADSYLLSFGSISDGISLRLSIDGIEPPILALKTPHDGLHIDSGTMGDEGKIHRALRLNRHELFTYGIDNGSNIDQYLALSSDSGRTLILDKNSPELFADLQLKKLYAHDVDITGLLNILLPDGQLQIGDVLFTPRPSPGGLDIDGDIHFTGLIELDTVDIETSEIRDLTITEVIELKDDGTRIEFSDGGETSEITTTYNAQIEITSETPVRYKTPIILDGVSGRDATTERINGISFINDEEPSVQEYSSIYTASQGGGAATPSVASTYIEMHYPESSNLEDNVNGLWLLRSTRIPQIEKEIKYSWKSDDGVRVDDLTKWPRAKLAAGFGDFYSIRVNASNLVDKDGVKFGDFNYIFVTGDGGNCPAGLMVIESLAGVAMVQAGMDPADCSNVVYSSLIVGDIQSRGSISAEDNISAGGGVNAGEELSGDTLEIRKNSQIFGDERVFGNETVDGDFFVLGASSFNSNVDINGQLKVSNEADIGNLKVNGVSEFGEIARFNSAVDMSESLSVDGLAAFNGNADFRARITGNQAQFKETSVTTLASSGLIYANGGLIVSANATVKGNLIGESNLDIKGSALITSALYARGVNSTADLNVAARTTLDGELSTRSNVIFSGDTDLEFVSNIPSQFTKPTSFNDGITSGGDSTFNGTLKINGHTDASTLDVGNVNVTNTLSVVKVASVGSLVVDSDINIGGSVTIGRSSSSPVLVNVAGAVTSSESIFSNTEISANGTITSGAGFNAGNASDSYMHNLTLTGECSITRHLYGRSGATFFGDTRVTSNFDVDGVLRVGQTVKIEIGDGRIAVGNVNKVSSSGEADDPGQLSVSYGTFKLVDGVTNGNLLPIPAGDNNTDFQSIRQQALQVDNYLRHENMHVNGTAVFAGQVIMNNDIWTNSIRPINVEETGQDWVDIVAREAYYAPD
ncbi:MAG: hypothetical protein DRQ78_00765 [Epsilonproteobacteria bacterium]|nr:MAG: hypothetical protein DRQ78_00765 [Campylobacterota bacterium]